MSSHDVSQEEQDRDERQDTTRNLMEVIEVAEKAAEGRAYDYLGKLDQVEKMKSLKKEK